MGAHLKEAAIRVRDVGRNLELRLGVQNLDTFTCVCDGYFWRTGAVVQITLDSIDIEQNLAVLFPYGIGREGIIKDRKRKLDFRGISFVLNDIAFHHSPCPELENEEIGVSFSLPFKERHNAEITQNVLLTIQD